MKKPLAVGDRVRVYGASLGGANINERTGVVSNLFAGGWVQLKIIINESPGFYAVQEKQIRRLVPKKKPMRVEFITRFTRLCSECGELAMDNYPGILNELLDKKAQVVVTEKK